jgi:hypothetical protein
LNSGWNLEILDIQGPSKRPRKFDQQVSSGGVRAVHLLAMGCDFSHLAATNMGQIELRPCQLEAFILVL